MNEQKRGPKKEWELTAYVNGEPKLALIESGSRKTLVRDLKGHEKGKELMIGCIHGDVKAYKTAYAMIEIKGGERKMEIGIVLGLTREMLIGRDWEVINELISSMVIVIKKVLKIL